MKLLVGHKLRSYFSKPFHNIMEAQKGMGQNKPMWCILWFSNTMFCEWRVSSRALDLVLNTLNTRNYNMKFTSGRRPVEPSRKAIRIRNSWSSFFNHKSCDHVLMSKRSNMQIQPKMKFTLTAFVLGKEHSERGVVTTSHWSSTWRWAWADLPDNIMEKISKKKKNYTNKAARFIVNTHEHEK